MTPAHSSPPDLRQFGLGLMNEMKTIRVWMDTLGHGESAAARDTQYILDVANELDVIVDRLSPVWQAVQAHERGDASRTHVTRAVEKYEAADQQR